MKVLFSCRTLALAVGSSSSSVFRTISLVFTLYLLAGWRCLLLLHRYLRCTLLLSRTCASPYLPSPPIFASFYHYFSVTVTLSLLFLTAPPSTAQFHFNLMRFIIIYVIILFIDDFVLIYGFSN